MAVVAFSASAEFDRRRLHRGALISGLLWAIFLPLLALFRYEGPPIEASMNPVFVELAPPQVEPQPEPPPADPVAPAAITANANAAAAATPAAPASAASAAAPTLRPDPAAPRGTRTRTPSSARGGGDPFSPLSEDSLAAAAPRDPTVGSPTPDPRATASGAAAAAAPVKTPDAFDRALGTADRRLAAGPAAASTTPAPKSGSGDLDAAADGSSASAGFDFGGGAVRELWSPRRVRVPDRLLSGLPDTVQTKVTFTVEAGGTVFAGSIRFDPPLPADLDAFLRAAFSSWLFSPAASDGQVVFRYSISVR